MRTSAGHRGQPRACGRAGRTGWPRRRPCRRWRVGRRSRGREGGRRGPRSLAVAADLTRRADAALDVTAGAEILRAQVMMAAGPDAASTRSTSPSTAARTRRTRSTDAFAGHRAAFEAAGGYLAERVGRPRRHARPRRRRAASGCRCRACRTRATRTSSSPTTSPRPTPPASTRRLVLALVTERGRADQPHRDPGPDARHPGRGRAAPGALDAGRRRAVPVDGDDRVVVAASRRDEDQSPRTGRGDRAPAPGCRSTGPGRTADGHPVALLANIGPAADLAGAAGRRRGRRAVPHRVPLPRPRRRRRALTSRSPRTPRCFDAFAGPHGRRPHARRRRRQAAAVPAPAPTSPTRRSASAACGSHGAARRARRPSSPRSPRRPRATGGRRLGDGADGGHGGRGGRRSPRLAATHGLPTAGVMVEVPAAALRAGQVLAGVRLPQHRHQRPEPVHVRRRPAWRRLADLLDPWQPALLDAGRVLRGGRREAPASRSGCAARRPPTRCSPWCWSGSASPACPWRPAACRRCASPWPRTPWTSAAGSPRRSLLPPARRQPGRRRPVLRPSSGPASACPCGESVAQIARNLHAPLTCCWNQPFVRDDVREPWRTVFELRAQLDKPRRSVGPCPCSEPGHQGDGRTALRPPDHRPAVRQSTAGSHRLSRAGWSSARIGRR